VGCWWQQIWAARDLEKSSGHVAAVPALPLLLLPQVERALLDLCLDPSDSYLAAVAVDMGNSLAEGSVSSSVRLYEVRRLDPLSPPRAGPPDMHKLSPVGWFLVACLASALPLTATCTHIYPHSLTHSLTHSLAYTHSPRLVVRPLVRMMRTAQMEGGRMRRTKMRTRQVTQREVSWPELVCLPSPVSPQTPDKAVRRAHRL
jgi:hypothetical protein